MISLAHNLAQSVPLWWPWPQRHRDLVDHWTDAFSFMDLVPGPAFLFWFSIYAIVVLYLCVLLRNLLMAVGESSNVMAHEKRLPFNLKPTFMEIAYLQGGRRAMLIAAVCNLYRMGILTRSVVRAPAFVAPTRIPLEQGGIMCSVPC